MTQESDLRQRLCDAARRIHAAGLAAGADGNVSARLAPDRVLISASGTSLGRLAPTDLVLIDAHGNADAGGRRPSSERWMHLAAYARRPDIGAIAHAHPPSVVALTLAGVALPADVLPEIIIAFGAAPVAPYATPGTPDGAAAVAELVRGHDAIILDRHGALAMGTSPEAAVQKLEQLEHAARTIALAHQIAGDRIRRLPPDEVEKLHRLRSAYHGQSD